MSAELLLPTGFFLFFFGVGGLLTAFLTLLGISSFPAQGLAFTGISLFCVVLLRKPLLTKFHFRNSPQPVDSIVGETAKALDPLAPHERGTVELRGSSWSALNTGATPIVPGDRCKVEKVEGLTLHVKL